MKKIIVIDGNSLLFRCYYATSYSGEIMRNKEGIPTNAIFAFSNMMNKIINELKEDEAIFVAFDAGKHNFRHEALETYKANRKPAPQELVQQFPIVRDFLHAIGIPQYEIEGYEGDDIAGTVCRLAEKDGYKVCVYTSDRDFLQLVTDNINVHILKTGLSNVMVMTPEEVEKTYGFTPLQIIDYKGLRGDSSDNLPGIPGIGEVTAVKLLKEYGSFDNIIANADNIGGKVGKNIKEHGDIGRISRDLAIIRTDIELPFKINDLTYQGYDFQTLNEFCQKYELKSFINKVSPKWKRKEIDYKQIEIKEINSFKDVELEGSKIGLALDYIDDDYTASELYGLSVSDGKNNYYISYENIVKDERLLSILKDENIKKYCYDYKAIKVNLGIKGIEVNGLEFDLLLAAYIIDSSATNKVDFIMNLFGMDLGTNEEVSLFSENNSERTAKIALYSLVLYNKVIKELEKLDSVNLYQNLELPLSTTLADMEIEGFPLDKNVLNEIGEPFRNNLKALEAEIQEIAGMKFNIASPKQVGDVLFNKLGLPAKNKKMSTSIEVLNELKDAHPIVPKLIEYRKYFKLLTTYVDGLIQHVRSDNKMHAKFNQALTQTGRLSSSDPNLQNISVRDEESKMIRKAFYYQDEDYEILSLDYSQIELRILAYLSNCQGLIDIFKSGKDIHTETAKTLFKCEGEPTSLQRRNAKTVNFGIVYGISDWGLAEQLEIPPYEARDIINSFYNSYPEVASFFQTIVADVTKNGYVSTLNGRRRYIREIYDGSYQVREFAKRAAMNAPIQGTAADLIKIAMNLVSKKLKEGNYRSKMVLQIHDELIFKVHKEEKEIIYNLVKNTMETAMNLSIPLEVDGGFGKTWYDAK